MNKLNKINDYINDTKLDLDRIVDDFAPYIKAVINHSANEFLTKEDKEEILEDTFVILWKNQDKEIVYLEAYLSAIARNLVREKLRKIELAYDISDYENMIPYYDEIEMFSEQREKVEKLNIVYQNLKEIDLKIINLYYYSSKSTKEIARELNMSESNVKTKLFRIRKKLKKYLS